MSSSPPELSLALRAGLPEAWRVLLPLRPRETWGLPDLHPTARFWLQMHDGFRREAAHMDALTGRWRSDDLALPELHRRLIPALQQFLQHLDGHHRVETHHYFPTMRRIEPRIGAGIDLLDRDHDAIHGHLEALFKSGLAFHQAVVGQAPDAGDAAARLADILDRSAPALTRHLEDEEEVVIPLICQHADSFRG